MNNQNPFSQNYSVFNRSIQKKNHLTHAKLVALNMPTHTNEYDPARKPPWPWAFHYHIKVEKNLNWGPFYAYLMLIWITILLVAMLVAATILGPTSYTLLNVSLFVALFAAMFILYGPAFVQKIIGTLFDKQFSKVYQYSLPYELIYDDAWRTVIHAFFLKEELLVEKNYFFKYLFRTDSYSALESELKLDLDLEDTQLWINKLEEPVLYNRIRILKQLDTNGLIQAFGNRDLEDLYEFFRPFTEFEQYVEKVRNDDDFRRQELMRTTNIKESADNTFHVQRQADDLFEQGVKEPSHSTIVSSQNANQSQEFVKQMDLSGNVDLIQLLTDEKERLKSAVKSQEENSELLIGKNTEDTPEVCIRPLNEKSSPYPTVYLLAHFPDLAKSDKSFDRLFEQWYSEVIWQIIIGSIRIDAQRTI